METELLCPLCSQEYQNDNLPRLLTLCGHTFCQNCIMKTIKIDDDQRICIQCPQDQKIITLKEKNIALFPKNIALIKMMENKRNSCLFKHHDVSFDLSKIVKGDQFVEDQFTKDFFAENTQQNIVEASNCSVLKYQECSTFEVNEYSKCNDYRSEKNFQICLLHQKPLDIVCIKDLEKICTNCAIFGGHKGHDCKSIQDIEKEQNEYCNQILSIIQRKQFLEKAITNQKNEAEILEILKKKSDVLQNRIKEHFRELKEQIEQAERKSLKKMGQIICRTEVKLKELLKLSPCIRQKYYNWEVQSLEILNALESHQYEDSLAVLLDEETKGKSFLKRGSRIVQEIVIQQKQLIIQVQKILDRIGYSHSNKITQLIDSYIQPFENQEKIQTPYANHTKENHSNSFSSGHRNQCEDSLLEDISCPQQKSQVSVCEPQFIKHSQASIDCSLNVQFLQNNSSFVKESKDQTENQASKKSTPNQRARLVSKAESFTTSVNQSLIGNQKTVKGEEKQRQITKKKKTVKIVVPQKYEKVLQGIKQNQLETIDFTNAQLGDVMIMAIAELITSTRARTVKFIRNKLTDECIGKIMTALSSVNTLNLSQNGLTQNSLDFLIDFFEKEPTNIKSIILSQNKIIQRKHKLKLEKLRKMNIIVSV